MKDKLRVTVYLFRGFVNIENQPIQISLLLEMLLFQRRLVGKIGWVGLS